MDVVVVFIERIVGQLQSPTLAFLIAGMLIAAVRSKFQVPEAIYEFCVFMLLMRVGLSAGVEIRQANLADLILPAIICAVIAFIVVFLGSQTLARLPGVRTDDALATSGLFGAVSAGTLIAAMIELENSAIYFEAWVPALYPFMDIPALVSAIVLANILMMRQRGTGTGGKIAVWPIIKDSLQGSALTILIIGVLLGVFARPEVVLDGDAAFYDLLFRGFLSILMLSLGIDAFHRLKELAAVGHYFIAYSVLAPIVHGMIGFGLGYVAHVLTGFSPGGVIMLAILAASNSDVSGPPTIRAGIPSANPGAYIGSSTGVGTPVAIGICIPLFIALGKVVFGL